jgi:hypothetical protein
MKKLFVLFSFLFLLASCSQPNCEGNSITVTGYIRSVGNCPVNEYVIDAENTTYVIDKKYAEYIGYRVQITGTDGGASLYGERLDVTEIIIVN